MSIQTLSRSYTSPRTSSSLTSSLRGASRCEVACSRRPLRSASVYPKHAAVSVRRPIAGSSVKCRLQTSRYSAFASQGLAQLRRRASLVALRPRASRRSRVVDTQSHIWWWVAGTAAACVAVGLVAVHLTVRALSQRYKADQIDKLSTENDKLRTKVEQLRTVVAATNPSEADKLEELFVPGINKQVLLSRVDNMLADDQVNIKWLPDVIERQLYLNAISLMLQVMNDALKGMSIEFAGHRVKFNLTFLDVIDADKRASSYSGTPTAKKSKTALDDIFKVSNKGLQDKIAKLDADK